MKLKVPVNSLLSAEKQIAAGADEIYVAFSEGSFENFTFSGRGKNTYGKIKTEVEYNEFKDIVALAHQNNVIVELAANSRYMMDSYNGDNVLQRKFLEYVERGINTGIDRIIIADLGNLVLVKKTFPDIPIIASVYFGAFNEYNVQLLESLGVQRIVLDHCVTMSDIEAIVKKSNVEIEVFGHLGCSFIHYTCGLHHSGVTNMCIGLPCLSKYKVDETNSSIDILNTMENCSICALPNLKNAGVTSLKIVGRELNIGFSALLTSVYSTALSLIEQDIPINKVREILKNKFDFDWWEESYCQEKACKYRYPEFYV